MTNLLTNSLMAKGVFEFTLFKNAFIWYLEESKRNLSFQGRLSRGEFWSFFFLNYFFMFFVFLIPFFTSQLPEIITDLIFIVLAGTCVFNFLGACVRRFHDIDLSGFWILTPGLWFVLVAIVPSLYSMEIMTFYASLNKLIIFIAILLKGNPLKNKYDTFLRPPKVGQNESDYSNLKYQQIIKVN